jgi:hypothetical protein
LVRTPAVLFKAFLKSGCRQPIQTGVTIGKAIPVTGVEAPTFSKQSAHRWRRGCLPYAPAALYLQEDSWYSFLLEAESTPGP